MNHPKNNRSHPVRTLFAGLLIAVLAAGCEETDSEPKTVISPSPSPTTEAVSPSPSPSPAVTPSPIVTPSPSPSPVEIPPKPSPASVAQTTPKASATVFWLDANAQTVKVVPGNVAIEAKDADRPETKLTGAFQQLLAGPNSEAQTSSIPPGTRLLGLKQQPEGVSVNLSEDFVKGGGTMSMTGRVAQVIYTATALNPESKVWIEVEGKRLEVLGGEGLVLDQPLTRQKFEKDFAL